MKPKMKVTLVRPTTFINATTHPLNLSYIYSSLETEDYLELDYVDGEGFGLKYFKNKNSVNVDSAHPMWQEVAQAILKTKPDMVGFSCYSLSMTGTKFIITLLRDYGLKGQIWAGGIHPTTTPIETLENIAGMDGVVIGEGEITIKEVCRAIYNRDRLCDVKGIAYRENGEIKQNVPRPYLEDLDELPIPTRTFSAGRNMYSEHIMLTSRGCPFACDFCDSKNMWTRRVRYRSGDHVAREIKFIADMGVKYIGLRDDIFGMHKTHVENVGKAIWDNGLQEISYSVGSRIDTMSDDMLWLLRKMNVDQVSFGIETGSPAVQKRIIKDVGVADVVPTILKTNQAGIRTITFFMLGHPGETEEEIKETFAMIRELSKYCHKRNFISINIVCPYPDTGYWTYAVKKYGNFVDFYKDSHRYYHQASPFVNITNMDDAVFNDYVNKINRYAKKVNLRYRSYAAIERPWLLASRIKRVGSNLVLRHV